MPALGKDTKCGAFSPSSEIVFQKSLGFFDMIDLVSVPQVCWAVCEKGFLLNLSS